MKIPFRFCFAWGGLLLCVAGCLIGLNQGLYSGRMAGEFMMAAGLLLVNYVFFLLAGSLPRLGGLWTEPVVGLIWVALKLFVNTFTIFLFIGLHAGRTHVFVVQFFGPYLLMLFGGVVLLSWNTRS